MKNSIVYQPHSAPKATLIWCHGLGADGSNFYDMARALQQPHFPLHVIMPDAPIRPVTLNAGMPMRAWYDIKGLHERFAEEADGIGVSEQRINQLIDTARQDLPNAPVFLGGFSQGGAMALHTGLRYPAPLAGIIGFSCYLPLASMLSTVDRQANQHTPILLAHGVQDDVVPLAWGQKSRDILVNEGHLVTWQTYPMAHNVCEPQVKALQTWMQSLLPV